MPASVEYPEVKVEMDVLVDVPQVYGWQLLVGGRPQLLIVRKPRLLDCLWGGHCGQPILVPAASWH